MRIYELFHAIVDKFVPMDQNTKLELQAGALTWYNKQRESQAILDAKNKEIVARNDAGRDKEGFEPEALLKPTMKDKIFQLLEQWWVRYIIAIAFIFIVPKVKAIINGETSGGDDDDDEEDDGDDFAAFMQYRRFKKSMK